MAEIRDDSRLLLTRVFKDDEGNEFFDSYEPIIIAEDESEERYQIEQVDLARFDKIAQAYFANPFIWWAITQYNKFDDPFSELDFSDEVDQPVYPNYMREGHDALIHYPPALMEYASSAWEITISDILRHFLDTAVPEHILGDKIKVPFRTKVQEAMADAQNRSSAVRV